MIITVEKMKNYLRVDGNEDDNLIRNLIQSSETLCMGVARIEDYEEFVKEPNAKVAVMYAVAYCYEHREEADHKALELSLRALLSGIRKVGF